MNPTHSNVYGPIDCDITILNDCEDFGEARLLRTESGLVLNIAVDGLRKGHVFTVWWIVFNNPGACSAPGCGADDLGDPDVNATVIWATGFATTRSGIGKGRTTAAHVTAVLNEGDLPPEPFGLPGDDDGLEDATVAEIHAVIRSHGPTRKRLVNEQMTTFGGGCIGNDVEGSIPRRKGQCADILFLIFLGPLLA
ncbi:MAG: hypothetical protein R3316_04085 [Rhodovibrionaceae bacterium]|nr:hypothetical protein [Rhodovibrionaceae bacterium]